MSADIIKKLEADARCASITAWRYLAFLNLEQRHLLHELGQRPDDGPVFFPVDGPVNLLFDDGQGPFDRADRVLRCAGVEDPGVHDDWVDFIGTDWSSIPIIGSTSDGLSKAWRKTRRRPKS